MITISLYSIGETSYRVVLIVDVPVRINYKLLQYHLPIAVTVRALSLFLDMCDVMNVDVYGVQTEPVIGTTFIAISLYLA